MPRPILLAASILQIYFAVSRLYQHKSFLADSFYSILNSNHPDIPEYILVLEIYIIYTLPPFCHNCLQHFKCVCCILRHPINNPSIQVFCHTQCIHNLSPILYKAFTKSFQNFLLLSSFTSLDHSLQQTHNLSFVHMNLIHRIQQQQCTTQYSATLSHILSTF